MDDETRRTRGTAMRRQVLGDAYVDRANEHVTDFSAEFQDLLTRYAWGEIWTRPGLDVRTRRMIVLGTLLALGRWEEFRAHAVAALTEGGFSMNDLKEVALQQAIYCGVPAANTAFSILGELDEPGR